MATLRENELLSLRTFLAAKKDGSKHGLEILEGHPQGSGHDRDAVAARSLQRAAYRRAFRTEQDIRRFFRRSGAMGRDRHRRRGQGVLRRQRSEMAGGRGKT